MHFFNPVHLMKLVEVVRHAGSAPAAVALAVALAEKLGKTPIVVTDSPGFASSRLGLVLGLEAMRMIEQNVASAADIDTAMKLGYGHPMGPLELTDLVGLDVRLGIAEYLSSVLGEAFTPPDILRDKVADGKLGKKTGEGFYRWLPVELAPANPEPRGHPADLSVGRHFRAVRLLTGRHSSAAAWTTASSNIATSAGA
jgi:3-hydroxybutyryl-CoA dehydrogenase